MTSSATGFIVLTFCLSKVFAATSDVQPDTRRMAVWVDSQWHRGDDKEMRMSLNHVVRFGSNWDTCLSLPIEVYLQYIDFVTAAVYNLIRVPKESVLTTTQSQPPYTTLKFTDGSDSWHCDSAVKGVNVHLKVFRSHTPLKVLDLKVPLSTLGTVEPLEGSSGYCLKLNIKPSEEDGVIVIGGDIMNHIIVNDNRTIEPTDDGVIQVKADDIPATFEDTWVLAGFTLYNDKSSKDYFRPSALTFHKYESDHLGLPAKAYGDFVANLRKVLGTVLAPQPNPHPEMTQFKLEMDYNQCYAAIEKVKVVLPLFHSSAPERYNNAVINLTELADLVKRDGTWTLSIKIKKVVGAAAVIGAPILKHINLHVIQSTGDAVKVTYWQTNQ